MSRAYLSGGSDETLFAFSTNIRLELKSHKMIKKSYKINQRLNILTTFPPNLMEHFHVQMYSPILESDKIGRYRPLDGVTNPNYKLLSFLTTKFFCRERKALAFNRDRCCHLMLCLWLILFHLDRNLSI